MNPSWCFTLSRAHRPSYQVLRAFGSVFMGPYL